MSRVFRAIFVSLLVCFAVPGLSSAQTGDRAFGSGEADLGEFAQQSFSFDARSGPLGQDPEGTFRFEFSGDVPEGSIAGEVTCLQVVGNRAYIAGTATSATGDYVRFEGGTVTWTVDDNSPSTPGPDRLSAFSAYPEADGPVAEDTPFCKAPFPQNDVIGEITVQDDTHVDPPSLPTSKAQCGDGGFKGFAVFKNQGDCKSFVATGGKNEPGKNLRKAP